MAHHRDEMSLINYGLRIAQGAPSHRVKRLVRSPVRAPAHALREDVPTELGAALLRTCKSRGLMPPRVQA
jgi:hypothetical protein